VDDIILAGCRCGCGSRTAAAVPHRPRSPLIEGIASDGRTIAFDGKRLLIVGDSGWATIDKPDFRRAQGAPIIAVPLNADCKLG
jgi:hypothetical protein